MKRVKHRYRYAGGKLPAGVRLISRDARGIKPVGTPNYFANPYSVAQYGRRRAVQLFRADVEAMTDDERIDWLAPLMDYGFIQCSCELDQECHGDVLLEYITKHFVELKQRVHEQLQTEI